MRRAAAIDPPAVRLDRARPSIMVVPLFLTFGMASAQDPPEVEAPIARVLQDESPQLTEEDLSLTGFLNLRWRSRWADTQKEDDHDLYGVLGVDLESGGSNAWGFHVLGRGAWSIDKQNTNSVFFSSQDTHGSELDGDLYHAYFDLPEQASLKIARLGRMLVYETPETIHFDGAHLESSPFGPARFSFGAYGGSSVHLAEDWPSEEWLAGLYTEFQPWERGESRIDWMHFEDDERFDGLGENDLVNFGLEHRLFDELLLEGEYSVLDGNSRDMRYRVFLTLPEQGLSVRASYYRLLKTQLNYAYELNPYFNFLNVQYPYDQGQLVITKTFGEVLEVLGGVDARRIENQQDIGQFNRDFDRFYATVSLPDLLPLNTTPSFTGEIWDSPQNNISTWGGDLTSQFDEETRISAGTYYSLYKYFADIASEREQVRTYYGEIRHEASESVAFRIRYEYEDEANGTFHNLRLGVTWQF